MLLVFFVVIVGIGVWLVSALIDARHADECITQGLRNCSPIENAAAAVALLHQKIRRSRLVPSPYASRAMGEGAPTDAVPLFIHHKELSFP